MRTTVAACLALLVAACGGGGGSPAPRPAPATAPVLTVHGYVGVQCGPSFDRDEFLHHWNRDLDRGCRPEWGVRQVQTEGRVLVVCDPSLEGAHGRYYSGGGVRNDVLVVRTLKDVRHERDHWLADRVGLRCPLDPRDDFCC